MSGGDGELIAAFLLADEVESDICVFTGGADVVAVVFDFAGRAVEVAVVLVDECSGRCRD